MTFTNVQEMTNTIARLKKSNQKLKHKIKLRNLHDKVDLYKKLGMSKTEIYEQLVMDERSRHGKQTTKAGIRFPKNAS